MYNFSFIFLYWYICFACWALANFMFVPRIVIQLCNVNQQNVHFSNQNINLNCVHFVGLRYVITEPLLTDNLHAWREAP